MIQREVEMTHNVIQKRIVVTGTGVVGAMPR